MSWAMQMVIDGAQFEIGDMQLPAIDQQTGMPTGEMVDIKAVNIIDPEFPARRVQLRLSPEQLISFGNACLNRTVQPASVQDLAALIGHG